MFESNRSVLLCVARSPVNAGHIVESATEARPSNIAWPDVLTLARLLGLVQSHTRQFEVRREDEASFNDLSQRPAILIGGFNDGWTLRLMNDGRFNLERDGPLCWIRDRKNPNDKRWRVDLSHTDSGGLPVLGQDYAIISRVFNPRTGGMLVLVAGLWGYGTQAAGEFLTNRKLTDSISGQITGDWENNNLQVVLGTEVIDKSPGPAHILAVHSWPRQAR